MTYLFWLLLALYVLFLGIFFLNVFYLWLGKRSAKPENITLPSISILIPARNEAENLKRLIPSLLKQNYYNFDIWIYDDHSEDMTFEVIQAFKDFRINAVKGEALPEGWVGKVHALYQLTRRAEKDVYLFLDADTCLKNPNSLSNWATKFAQLPQPAYLSGLPHLQGGGKALVSLVPFAILGVLPLVLMKWLPFKSLSMLNGQFWMVRNAVYHHFEPHLRLKNAILEDVEIGRYLKSKKVIPYLADIAADLEVWMYADFKSAWEGFRKNTYLIMGGNPLAFLLIISSFGLDRIFSRELLD